MPVNRAQLARSRLMERVNAPHASRVGTAVVLLARLATCVRLGASPKRPLGVVLPANLVSMPRMKARLSANPARQALIQSPAPKSAHCVETANTLKWVLRHALAVVWVSFPLELAAGHVPLERSRLALAVML